MSRSTASDRRQAGFTLVEVICAVAIAAMALVFLLRGVSGSSSAALYLEEHLGARLLARSILDIESSAELIEAGTREGASGSYRWRLSVEPDGATGPYAPRGWKLYRVRVEVAWGQRGQLELETVRLGK